MNPVNDPIVYCVIAAYLALMMGMGWAFGRLNRDTSDYFRSGQRGTWWLVGTSIYISSISAWTFTGGGGQAYEWGWAILWNYWPVGAGLMLCAVWFAPRFRQLRVTTGPEAIGLRFDELTRQLMAWKNLVGMPMLSGLHLYGLAIFGSAVFGFDLEYMIVALGVVVTVYSTAGGRFGVMGTDFLQTAIILPLAAVMAVLCLREFGGIGGFFEAIETAGLKERYGVFKGEERPANGTYGLQWIAASILFFTFLNNVNVGVASRFFSVKDSREAVWSAWLAGLLAFIGSLVWFIPPIAARLLYADQVATMPVPNPSEAAYAVASLQLLPAGLVGVLMVAIFASTMSSMDTSLNNNAGVLVRDIWPAYVRWRGGDMPSEQVQLRVAQLMTLVFGGGVVLVALTYSTLKELTLFELMMNVLALTGLPFQVPLFWGLFVRRVPRWSAVFSAAAALVPGIVMFFDKSLLGMTVAWEVRIFVQFAVGSAAFFMTRLWWSRVSATDRAAIDAFFERMNTPVDFEREVGQASDLSQLRIVGWFSLAVGAGVALLILVPDEARDRMTVAILAGVYGALGLLLVWTGRRRAPASR